VWNGSYWTNIQAIGISSYAYIAASTNGAIWTLDPQGQIYTSAPPPAATGVTLGALESDASPNTTFLSCSAGVYSGATGACGTETVYASQSWSNTTFTSALAAGKQMVEAQLAIHPGNAYGWVSCDSQVNDWDPFNWAQQPICPSSMSQSQCDNYFISALCF
jgi:hypothetical protein